MVQHLAPAGRVPWANLCRNGRGLWTRAFIDEFRTQLDLGALTQNPEFPCCQLLDEFAEQLSRDEWHALSRNSGFIPSVATLRRYEDRLARFLDRQTGGRDVEDLYQETWLRVVQHAERFDPQRRFSTWLFQIAVNLCRDWHRRPPPEPRPVDSEPAAAELERSDAALDAAQLLSTLPDAQREVVVLRYYHDMTEDEVARMETLNGTVRTAATTAEERIRKRRLLDFMDWSELIRPAALAVAGRRPDFI